MSTHVKARFSTGNRESKVAKPMQSNTSVTSMGPLTVETAPALAKLKKTCPQLVAELKDKDEAGRQALEDTYVLSTGSSGRTRPAGAAS